MFGTSRVFVQSDAKTGLSGWFFAAREGAFGPYPSREVAAKSLDEFIKQRLRENDDGGRTNGSGPLSLKPLEGPATHVLNWKSGADDVWRETRDRKLR